MSTGVIGVPMPMARVRDGVAALAPLLAANGGPAAAEAIMTTDTHPKRAAVEVDLPGGRVTIGGMAKGAGMIHPDMATLLGVLTTDAAIAPDLLNELLREAVAVSFNAISIDGDTSTNDTVLLFANGASRVSVDDQESRTRFVAALTELCVHLAQMIVRDGEGATRFVTLRVTGAESDAAARRAADTIATSPLVKTAFAGGDPNWGRIVMAAGRSGAALDPARLALWVEAPGAAALQLVRDGTPTGYAEADAADIFAQPEFTVRLNLGLGDGAATLWTTDLSHEYVSINADYRT
jgi:glutamate N-acetyltransferase/amino-acid N-acetyltransferase